MVQVYLPMGYSIQTGNEFETVIYQGDVVRYYTLAKDPRSNAQLQNRHFLHDVMKVKACLGPWAKASCRTGLGSRWGAIIYQSIKADVDGWWSSALEEWENFYEGNKDAWRGASPYQATFDDVGQIFFGLTRVIYHALLKFSDSAWDSAAWDEGESEDALIWWQRNLSGLMVRKNEQGERAIYGYVDERFSYIGSWTPDAPVYNESGSGPSNYLAFTVYGSGFLPKMGTGNVCGAVNVYCDGVFLATHDYTAYSPSVDYTVEYRALFKGLHNFEMHNIGNGAMRFYEMKVI
jgi:hypothetical protein